ncbi:hypothetical protein GO988_00515 [Hymenobacter sp. HMF4947]|uniref:DUF4369 domain-containing protein n=1 Tax=Hymenobacter ginkgonis TaxID=2682976 RepID=A0A7K1T8S6_9BACT|nr:hypothetical protein [Hymenobacter ginkgonis]MVN74800.1 hypothetical protein [Hymenobacter ginkgonis]
MRSTLLFLSLVAPLASRAQVFKNVEVGSYVLSTTPQVRQQGGLFLRNSEQLVVRDLAGKTATLTPQQVSSFRLDNKQFVSTGGFQLRGGFGDAYVSQAFAEQVDSGQVVLLRYRSVASNAPSRGNLGYGQGSAGSVYLLRQATTLVVTPIQASWTKGNRQFQAALRPYLASRPDLLQLLEARQLAPEQLPQVIHALNHNLPYQAAANGAAAK